jgi:hypothetical protein
VKKLGSRALKYSAFCVIVSVLCWVYWSGRAGGASLVYWTAGWLCLMVVFWLEYQWRGAKPHELAKLSTPWKIAARASEVVLLVSAKVWLVGVACALIGGNWFDTLVFGGLLGIACGWVGLAVVLRANRKVGFYTDSHSAESRRNLGLGVRGGRTSAPVVDPVEIH